MLFLCIGVYLAMGAQICLVYEAGYPLLNTALPLHICGMAGLLTAPVLYTNIKPLRAFYGFIGMPGALMALLFPAVMQSGRQSLMNAAFFTLHALIVICGGIAIFKKPCLRPRDAFLGYGAGVVFAFFVFGFNRFFHTNYLFLAFAPKGTPLEWIFRWGQAVYVLLLCLIAFLVVCIEALGLSFLSKSCIIKS